MPEISFLTNENQEKLAAGMYKISFFWKCIELVAAKNPTRAVSWVRAWWFILRPRLISALVRRYFSVSPAKYASSSFTLIFLSLLFTRKSFLIFRGLGPLLGSTASSSQLSSDEEEDNFSCPFLVSIRKHCRVVQTRQSLSKFLKGIIDRDRWESCQNTTGKSNHC